ncbi:MAG TPA: VpsF family polysaccharide biosynthesis protein [Pseudolabrys sp.]|nr:VpsF family polysaccharide biosynthesis protein [Pseudolabrys sp.]
MRTAAWRATPPPAAPIEWAVVALMLLALAAILLVSPALLTALKVGYVTNGGPGYQKLHPATYLTFAAFAAMLLKRGDPIGEIDRIATSAKLLIVFLACWGLLVLECIALSRPFTPLIDDFLLPVTFSVVVWTMTASQKRPLVWALHLFIWANIAAGYFEYFSGHRLVALTVGKLVVYGEWRSTAFLGTPLAASSVVALYALALALRPELCRPIGLRIPAIVLSVGSLMAFGGRTALMSVLVVLACIALATAFRLINGRRFALPTVMLAISGVFVLSAVVVLLYQHGTFDNMVNRFSSDKGSADARFMSLRLLGLLDWKEIVVGASQTHGVSLQTIMGLRYGIESFWIACIVQYGLVGTAIITIGLACFVVELLRRSDKAARVAILFLLVDASSSVSFSAKNITLAALIALVVILFPRELPRARTVPVTDLRRAPPRLSPAGVR